MKNPETETVPTSATGDMFDKLEAFLEKNRNIIMGLCLVVCTALCYALFDARMSFATDDSEYIKMAWNLLFHGAWPTYHGTLYPVMLAGLYKMFGLKMMLFKLFSGIYLVASVFLFYRAFRGKVPYTVLFVVLIYLSINSYFLYFSSQTYNEAFTLFLQALAFVFFMGHIRLLATNPSLKQSWKSWLMFGFMMLILTITKNILIVAVGGVALYFLIYKEWMNAVLSVLSFAVFKLPYELFVRSVFHSQTTGQLDQIMLKNFYNPAEGYEEFPGGYIDRFFTNFNNFISVQVFKVLGLRDNHLNVKAEDDASAIISLIFAAAIVLAFIILYKRNRYLMFSLLFAVGLWFITFASIQTVWSEQWRLIVPYVPYFLIAFFGALWYRVKEAKQPVLKPLFIGAMTLFILVQFPRTSERVSANSMKLKHFVKGEMTYGIPDEKNNIDEQWLPFVEICDSVTQKVPPTAHIATGKPGEAFVYSKFPNFERIPQPGKDEPADTVLAHLKKQGITHIFMDGSSIGKTVQIIEKQYPQKLGIVMQAGPDAEHALYLIEIKY